MVNKMCVLIASVAVALVIGLSIYYFTNFYPQRNTVPDDKGFIPLHIYFENGIKNITIAPGSTASVNVTLTSNLDKEITVTINPTLAALKNPPWFNATLQPNPVILKAYGTNSTTLTIHLTEETPRDIQPDRLALGLESLQYPNVRLWSASLQIYVKSQ